MVLFYKEHPSHKKKTKLTKFLEAVRHYTKKTLTNKIIAIILQ